MRSWVVRRRRCSAVFGDVLYPIASSAPAAATHCCQGSAPLPRYLFRAGGAIANTHKHFTTTSPRGRYSLRLNSAINQRADCAAGAEWSGSRLPAPGSLALSSQFLAPSSLPPATAPSDDHCLHPTRGPQR